MERCRICSARLFVGSTYCARCHAPVTPTEEEVAEARVDVAAAAGRWHDPRRQVENWQPNAIHLQPRSPEIHSRWRSGVFSFSLPTKVLISFVVVVALPWMAWKFTGGVGVGPIAIWHIIVTPRVLRDLWKRTRIS